MITTAESTEEIFSEAYNYHNGYNGRKKDPAKALELYIKAAEMDHVEAMYRASVLLEDKNSAQCLHWLTKAAEKGDEPSLAMLAQHYMEGKGIAHDFEKARKCFVKLCFSKDKGRREWAAEQLRKNAKRLIYSHK